MPGKNYPFSTSVDPVSPPLGGNTVFGTTCAVIMVEAPGTAPGSETGNKNNVYRHSRYRPFYYRDKNPFRKGKNGVWVRIARLGRFSPPFHSRRMPRLFPLPVLLSLSLVSLPWLARITRTWHGARDAKVLCKGQEGRMAHGQKKRTIDALIGHEFKVLDHGFVRLIDTMGDDAAIVQAARVSYGKGTKSTRRDEDLIRYLMRHHHTTPFEMCEIKLHVKMPIFVARQWVRHRTASINEYSARYSEMEREFYIPDHQYLAQTRQQKAEEERRREEERAEQLNLLAGTLPAGTLPARVPDSKADDSIDRGGERALAGQSKTNKQGREGSVSDDAADFFTSQIKDASHRGYAVYNNLLGRGMTKHDHGALSRELARMVLPTNYYTQWYWKCNLHNLFHFLALRDSPHAQWEIRQYAAIIGRDIVAHWVPAAWRAFIDYRQDARTLSGPAMKVVRALLRGTRVDRDKSGLGAREWRELCDAFDLNDDGSLPSSRGKNKEKGGR